MFSRCLFIIFTLVFLTYTWHQAGQAKQMNPHSPHENIKFAQLHETYSDFSIVY